MSVQLLGRCENGPQLNLPLYIEGQSSDLGGSAALDDLHGVDLNSLCIRHPESTVFITMESQAMEGVGIHAGDVLVVDQALTPDQGRVILAGFQGELLVRELQLRPSPRLIASNPDFDELLIPEHSELTIYGVVTQVIHTLRNN